uniref:B30.2/SPRY domain-containing protein n=2 Tax=Chrysotila carterae TaxID=13221 RepID=A0A7S4BVR1_CHRCT
MSPSMEVSEMAPLPVFRNGVPQNEAMRAHRGTYAIKHLGPHGKNVIVEGRIAKRAEADEIDMSGSMFVEDKCDDLAAVVVGARSAEFGVNTFTFRIERTYSNNGLGTFVGVADSGVDFLNHERWGAAWAIGCHGQNLFSWTDGRGAATLVRGGLPGSDESLPDGATIAVRVDLDARPRVLSFSVDGGPFIVAKGVELPRTVRPFCKLAGNRAPFSQSCQISWQCCKSSIHDRASVRLYLMSCSKLPSCKDFHLLCKCSRSLLILFFPVHVALVKLTQI